MENRFLLPNWNKKACRWLPKTMSSKIYIKSKLVPIVRQNPTIKNPTQGAKSEKIFNSKKSTPEVVSK